MNLITNQAGRQAAIAPKLEGTGYTGDQVHFDPYRDWETDRKSTRLNSSH